MRPPPPNNAKTHDNARTRQASEAPGPGAYDIAVLDQRSWLSAPAPKFGKASRVSRLC
jgi:hypothetical protein